VRLESVQEPGDERNGPWICTGLSLEGIVCETARLIVAGKSFVLNAICDSETYQSDGLAGCHVHQTLSRFVLEWMRLFLVFGL
jgi:hypothetical protein